jgi:hypothetical protein
VSSSISWDLRRLSTSSTVIAKFDALLYRGLAHEMTTAGADEFTVTAVKPLECCLGAVGLLLRKLSLLSKLALLRLLAPLENFSCHCSPSLRDSSVIGTQSGQHARSGIVRAVSSFRMWCVVRGREVLRIALKGVEGDEEGDRCTRHGERGLGVGGEVEVLLPLLGDREDLEMNL